MSAPTPEPVRGDAPLPAARTRGGNAPARLLAVGASNLARLALALLDAHRAATGGPVELHAAIGRGRSFGMPSRLVFVRGLPSVLASTMWERLGGGDRTAVTALLADVGNDLLYGVEVPRILDWASQALQRLDAHAARLVVVGLPLAAIRALPRWRYLAVRSVLVPGCRLSLRDAITGSEALHLGLRTLAAHHGAAFHEPPGAWYAFDPVHVRRSRWRTAARTWLGEPRTGAAPANAPPPRPIDTHRNRLAMLTWAPAERSWLGVRTTTPQPVRRFADGSSLSLW